MYIFYDHLEIVTVCTCVFLHGPSQHTVGYIQVLWEILHKASEGIFACHLIGPRLLTIDTEHIIYIYMYEYVYVFQYIVLHSERVAVTWETICKLLGPVLFQNTTLV